MCHMTVSNLHWGGEVVTNILLGKEWPRLKPGTFGLQLNVKKSTKYFTIYGSARKAGVICSLWERIMYNVLIIVSSRN